MSPPPPPPLLLPPSPPPTHLRCTEETFATTCGTTTNGRAPHLYYAPFSTTHPPRRHPSPTLRAHTALLARLSLPLDCPARHFALPVMMNRYEARETPSRTHPRVSSCHSHPTTFREAEVSNTQLKQTHTCDTRRRRADWNHNIRL